MASDTIRIVIKADDQFKAAFSDAVAKLGEVEKAADQTAKKGFTNLQASVVTLHAAWNLFGRSAIDLGKSIFNTAGEFETLELKLRRVTGSSQDAADAQDYLLDLARKSPVD